MTRLRRGAELWPRDEQRSLPSIDHSVRRLVAARFDLVRTRLDAVQLELLAIPQRRNEPAAVLDVPSGWLAFDLTQARSEHGAVLAPGVVHVRRTFASVPVLLRLEHWSATRCELRLDVDDRACRRLPPHFLDVANDAIDALRDRLRPREPAVRRASFARSA